MSLNRYAKRRDANEPEIFAAIQAAGYLVERMDLWDLLVQHRATGETFIVEVKTEGGAYTKRQKRMLKAGWKVLEARGVEDLAPLGILAA